MPSEERIEPAERILRILGSRCLEKATERKAPIEQTWIDFDHRNAWQVEWPISANPLSRLEKQARDPTFAFRKRFELSTRQSGMTLLFDNTAIWADVHFASRAVLVFFVNIQEAVAAARTEPEPQGFVAAKTIC
jgi:hypothetical protein